MRIAMTATMASGWPATAPEHLRLGPGEVHVWLARLDGKKDGTAWMLSAAERDRAASYDRARDGQRFKQARIALRVVLAKYLDSRPAELRLRADKRGRLALAGPPGCGRLEFSLAKTADVALVAVSSGKVGADIERIEPRPGLHDLAASLYSAAELACIDSGCGGSWLPGFYRHWTAREAYLKAVGVGLSAMRTMELACGPPATIWLPGRLAARWAVSSVDQVGYAVTVIGGGAVSSCRWLEA